MRRLASLLAILTCAVLVMPGCYTYDSQTADLGYMADGWGDQGSTEDVVEDTGNVEPDIADTDTSEEVVECECTCSPQPCTCTCSPGGECVFDPTAFPDDGRVGGDPCTTDGQCMTGLCATTEMLSAFWAGATAPDGMCTMLGCMSDAECGTGSVCLDTTELDPTIPFLCGQRCETDIDCRCGVDYICLDSKTTDGDGNPVKACLPVSLANLLACGDVVCE